MTTETENAKLVDFEIVHGSEEAVQVIFPVTSGVDAWGCGRSERPEHW